LHTPATPILPPFSLRICLRRNMITWVYCDNWQIRKNWVKEKRRQERDAKQNHKNITSPYLMTSSLKYQSDDSFFCIS
jgi:hypothetical protein